VAVTIKDVAKLAKVNPSTVSRVIANNPVISQETRQKVLTVMAELNYYPNLVARNLVSRITKTIGVVMPRSAEDLFLNPFFPEILRGISAIARRDGYDILLATGETEEEEKETILRMVHGRRVDGLILLVSRVENQLGDSLKSTDFPIAIVGKPLHDLGLCWVDNDNVEAAYKGTQHLLKLGHRTIGCITGPLEFVVTLDRLLGYQKALMEFGVEYDKELVIQGEFSQKGGHEAMNALLAVEPRITAVLVFDDLMAFGAIQQAKEQGRIVPVDISIIGFNNTPLSNFVSPPLTTVEIFPYQLGKRVTELVIQRIENPDDKEQHDYVGTNLILRQSCQRLKS
jgi:DNA-binding LacI/PurR family transcriptional regulator